MTDRHRRVNFYVALHHEPSQFVWRWLETSFDQRGHGRLFEDRMMYQDELYREAKMFVEGWQYILDDTAKFLRRVCAHLGLKA